MRNRFGVYLAALGVLGSLLLGTGGAKAGPAAYTRMMGALHELRTYQATVRATVTLSQVDGTTTPRAIKSTETILYQRPNKLVMKAPEVVGGLEVVSDGKMVYQYSALSNEYTARPAPASLVSAITSGDLQGGALRAAGRTQIDGTSVELLKGTITTPQGPAQMSLYVDTRDSLPRRIVVVVPRLPGPQGGAFRMVSEQDFVAQKVDPALSAKAFRFVPPAGATRVESLSTAGGAGGAADLGGMP